MRIGQEVKAGDLLVQLDRRQAEAQLKVNQAQVAVARATERQTEDTYKRDLALSREAISDEQRIIDEEAWRLAQAQRQVAEAAVQQAQTALDLLEIRAPSDGTILQVNVRPGEYVSILGGPGLILMGDLHPLHVRVNVDEEDVPRLVLNAPARAHIRGDPEQNELPLTFVRLEPYVVPKVSMTGINVERVDTRVVQVIYALDPANRLVREKKVLVGQLLDVFIDARRDVAARVDERERPVTLVAPSQRRKPRRRPRFPGTEGGRSCSAPFSCRWTAPPSPSKRCRWPWTSLAG